MTHGRKPGRRRRYLLSGLLVFILLLPAATANAKPILLLFHPGGFCFGEPSMMHAAATYAKPEFQPVEVDYPLCDLGAALRYSVRQAKRFPNRRIYAYGESAGGSIAARLGEMGLIRGAAVQDPVANVVKFIRPHRAYFGVDWADEARWVSPDRHRSGRRIQAWIAADDDSLVRDSWRWARSDPKVAGTSIPGEHLQEPYKTQAMQAAIAYLARRLDRAL